MPDNTQRTLVVLMAGKRVGAVTQGDGGRLAFEYDELWRDYRHATPLSLSMPLANRIHNDAAVRPFLWGLLPDNERVLERWARTYQVSAGNPFALLRHVGEDCAGAAQLVRPERVDAAVAGDGGVKWLDEDDLADRLRSLRADPTSWHVHDSGQFSLRDAHPPKTVEQQVTRFVDALALNWIIAGTDAHAKNYSVLLAGRQVRLAPLYDVASALPYDTLYLPRLRMAMRIGGEDRLDAISGRHWRRFAERNQLDPNATVARIDDLAARLPSSFLHAANNGGVEALESALPIRLAERIEVRARRCREALAVG